MFPFRLRTGIFSENSGFTRFRRVRNWYIFSRLAATRLRFLCRGRFTACRCLSMSCFIWTFMVDMCLTPPVLSTDAGSFIWGRWQGYPDAQGGLDVRWRLFHRMDRLRLLLNLTTWFSERIKVLRDVGICLLEAYQSENSILGQRDGNLCLRMGLTVRPAKISTRTNGLSPIGIPPQSVSAGKTTL